VLHGAEMLFVFSIACIVHQTNGSVYEKLAKAMSEAWISFFVRRDIDHQLTGKCERPSFTDPIDMGAVHQPR
jgi:hypothetical protein